MMMAMVMTMVMLMLVLMALLTTVEQKIPTVIIMILISNRDN